MADGSDNLPVTREVTEKLFEDWFSTLKYKPVVPPFDDWFVGMQESFIAGVDSMQGHISGFRKLLGSYKLRCSSLEAQIGILRDNQLKMEEAINSLDSERKANAILTNEVDALKKRNYILVGELLFINEDVWPLVHSLTSRETVKTGLKDWVILSRRMHVS